MHVEVVGLFKPPAALVTGEVQLSLCFMFGHVVLEGRSLPALEPTDLTPGGAEAGEVSCALSQS